MLMDLRGLSMPLATYRRRRQVALQLAEQAMFGPVPLLFLGCDETTLRRDRQDPWFEYYSGCGEPEAAVLIDPHAGTTLFLETGDPTRIIWDGPRLGPGPLARKAHGVDDTADFKALEERVVSAARAAGGRVGMCTRTREPGFQAHATAVWKTKLAAHGILVCHVEPALIRQRMIKDADEIAWHREAVRITRDGLRTVLPQIPKLNMESEVASLLTMHYRKHAYGPLAFPPIVGSAVHGATLHYPHNDRPLEPSRPLLIDSGATAGGYCADVTRTVPVHGRFDQKRFKEVYEIVLRANQLASSKLRPGMSHREWTEIGWGPILKAGFTRHHGLGHHLGVDVHDPADYDVPMTPGMLITNEPGIYLPDEGFGIRIEDDLLVTADGCEVLTREIPKTVAGIEAAMKG
jgi:Xaa-Pro aminopeptidase